MFFLDGRRVAALDVPTAIRKNLSCSAEREFGGRKSPKISPKKSPKSKTIWQRKEEATVQMERQQYERIFTNAQDSICTLIRTVRKVSPGEAQKLKEDIVALLRSIDTDDRDVDGRVRDVARNLEKCKM